MARSVFKSSSIVVVVAGQQLHQTTDFHRSQDGAANETNSDNYFYKQVAWSLLLRVYNVYMRVVIVELCV